MVFTGSRYPVMESFVTSVVGNDGNWAPIDSATFLFLPELQEELGDADNESLRMKQDVTKANGTENALDAECITVTLQGQALERSLQAQRDIRYDMPLRAVGRSLVNHRQFRNYKHVRLRHCRTAHVRKAKPCILLRRRVWLFAGFYDVLGRTVKTTVPGKAWNDSGKSNTVTYQTNTANEVTRYRVSGKTLTESGHYEAGELDCTTASDPDGHTLKTYRDVFGNVVMERRAGFYDTYYVYDGLNRLRFVLQPMYKNEKNLDYYACWYEYDGREGRSRKSFPAVSRYGIGMYKVVKFADSDKRDWQLGTNSLNFKAGDLPISGLILDFGLGNEDYTSEYSYDANGNITGAYRQGRAYGSDSDRSFDTIDDYMVKYKGNQKQSIEGGLNTDAVYYGSSAFVDGADKDVEYAYNANGSMTMDLNKGITDISYDNTGNLKKTSTRARSSTALSVSTGTTYTPGNITQ